MTNREDTIRVLRLVEYEGPRSRVEAQVAISIHGTRFLSTHMRIAATTLGLFPEIVEEARRTPVPAMVQDLRDEIKRLQNEVQELQTARQRHDPGGANAA